MKLVNTRNCQNGDILAEDVYGSDGVMLISQNTIINDYIKIKFRDLGIREVKIYDSLSGKMLSSRFEKRYKEYVIQMKEMLKMVILDDPSGVERITTLITEQLYANINESEYIIYCLNKIRSVDEYTGIHSINTAFYAMLLGTWLKLSKKQICELISASLIHDLGKIKIPGEILNKRGRLENNEYEIIKRHPILGYEIIKDTGFSSDIKKAVLMHHERMDGSGYPYGLNRNQISKYAQIISIADVFDAMTQNRIYKNKVSPFDTFEMFLTEGVRLFDYKSLYVFLMHMAPLYVGNKVQLSNGEIGEIVYIPPQDITNPILLVKSQYTDLASISDTKVLCVF